MALGLADLSTLTLRVGTVACFPGRLLYSVYTLLRSPEAVFKRRLMGVLKHPESPWVHHCLIVKLLYQKAESVPACIPS